MDKVKNKMFEKLVKITAKEFEKMKSELTELDLRRQIQKNESDKEILLDSLKELTSENEKLKSKKKDKKGNE